MVAAFGVGAGDMVVGVSGGARFGMSLAWAIVIGAIIKYSVTEGIGRWYLATGETPLRGIHSLGRWASGYFVAYLVVLGFAYGAAIISATALAATAMFPFMSLTAWAVVMGVIGFVIVLIGSYGVFENIMKGFVLLMFVSMVGAAVLTFPAPGELARGVVPSLPEGGDLLYVLGLMGGVGATLTLAAYGYWLRDKGWHTSSWIPTMRIDLAVGYTITFVFIFAMMILGTQFLFGVGTGISGEEGLANLADPLEEQFGSLVRLPFLLGFFSATFSSMIGGWNAFCYLFADYVRISRGIPDSEAEGHTSEKSPAFRVFLVWLAFPPMVLLLFEQPVLLVFIYAALGALAMPFLVLVLLWLLNSGRVEPRAGGTPLPQRDLVQRGPGRQPAAVRLSRGAGARGALLTRRYRPSTGFVRPAGACWGRKPTLPPSGCAVLL